MTYALHRDPRSSHQRIARYIRRLNRGPILDVGAASGQLGQLLAETGLHVDGIEPDEASAEAARRFYREMSVSRVENADLPASTYRIVVCADVLEHTPDPPAVLTHLIAASTDDAVFLISLPNIGHLAARLIVLAGRFPEHDRGIFDRTHLHFYTRDTALALVRSVGLEIRGVAVTPVPLEDVWPRVLGEGSREVAMRVQMVAAALAPTLFGFQWMIVARRT